VLDCSPTNRECELGLDRCAMAEPWGGVGTAVTAGTHMAKEGLLGGCDAHTSGETSVGTLQAT
jgi:hypothetical protein